ncbi:MULTISPECIES: VanZ family protein [Paenibacillus]|uniref:VanZ protein n=1 Tax=Paenibacillus illinoisensis TaxID=59845 RepID=A0A2W0CEL6_9BACL|nr:MULTISPECIES: VanZ family protein [Paenibacillus]MBM6386102.1 VanZ family protein [Paenibacillus sp.]PAD28170.1 VanZ family protein [Paenibacillus sp. 7523-1]PYY31423.1 VanZ protein [Paenibacillus illinoisensis]
MRQRKIKHKILWIAALIIYLYLLTKLILFKGGPVDFEVVRVQLMAFLHQPDLIHTRTVNLTPFQEISRDWNSLSLHRPGTAIHLVGNVMAFIPLGMFIPMLMGNKLLSGANVFLSSLLLSLGYEVTQLLTGMGIFDVDDLMLNTLGGVIGYILFTMALGMKRLLIGGESRTVKKEYNPKESPV